MSSNTNNSNNNKKSATGGAAAANQGIRSFEEIAIDKFTYAPPHSAPGKPITNINMNYERAKVKIQSPLLACPFGISVMKDKKNPNAEPAYSVEVQLGNDTPKSEAFTKWLETLDNRVITDAKTNSNSWLKKATLTDRVAKEIHNPCVKKYYDKELCQFTDKYPARCRFKIQRKNDKFVTKIFNSDRQPIDLDSMSPDDIDKLGKGHRMRVIFEMGGVWAGAKGFGVTMRAVQIMLFAPQKLTGFGFLHDVEDDTIFPPNSPVATVVPSPSPAASSEAIPQATTTAEVNSDEEGDGADAAEEASSSNVAETPEAAVVEETPVEGVEEPVIIEDEAEEGESPEPAPKAKAKPKKAVATPTVEAKAAPKQATITKFSKKK